MSVIKSRDVYQIIIKTLGTVNSRLIQHGETVSYLLYRVLKENPAYLGAELAEYAMVGLLHDIGLYKEDTTGVYLDFEKADPGPHSLYGYLFIKFLSPLGDKADIIKYHHVNYNRYSLLKMSPRNREVVELLNLVDKMNLFRRGDLTADYFRKNRDVTFSGKALDNFLRVEAKEHMLEKLRTGEYKAEMDQLWETYPFSEKTKRSFLEMLVYIIDFRSEFTVIHTVSTVNFAEQLGYLMGVSAEDLQNIHYGALLHDLGKIAIPLDILESTGKLTPGEMEIMKSHVIKTEAILKGSIDDTVLQIAVRHHEKLDGSGYPRGLREKDLTIPQQITAVADILSALYGKRSYKEAFDKEKIKQLIQKDASSGKISKAVVKCLMEHYDTVIANYEKEKENTVGLYLRIRKDYDDSYGRFKNIV